MLPRCIYRPAGPSGSHEDAGQCVVVPLGDRVELVIVAARAGNRHSKERLGKGIDLVVDHFLVNAIELHAVSMAVFSHVIEHGTDQAFVETGLQTDSRVCEEIARDLLADQLIESDVLIESTGKVVPVFPRTFRGNVPLVAVGIGIADDIHPMPGKPFAEVGRGEEIVDKLGKGILAVAIPGLPKCLHFFRLWRKPR